MLVKQYYYTTMTYGLSINYWLEEITYELINVFACMNYVCSGIHATCVKTIVVILELNKITANINGNPIRILFAKCKSYEY